MMISEGRLLPRWNSIKNFPQYPSNCWLSTWGSPWLIKQRSHPIRSDPIRPQGRCLSSGLIRSASISPRCSYIKEFHFIEEANLSQTRPTLAHPRPHLPLTTDITIQASDSTLDQRSSASTSAGEYIYFASCLWRAACLPALKKPEAKTKTKTANGSWRRYPAPNPNPSVT